MSSYPIPNVIVQHPRGDRVTDVYSHLLSERVIYLGTEIDDGVANTVVAQLLHLEADRPEAEINLYINSPGGSLTATLAIYDAMQFIRSPVATTGLGQAGANAGLLLAAGSPGRRGVLPHARVLLHQLSAQSRGTIPDLIVEAEEVSRLRNEAELVLSRHTGQSVERLRRDTDRDLVLTPQAAVDYGIADHVIAYRKEVLAPDPVPATA
ncbi:ClpP family protease [Ornithinicoccus hortensis]|uniref:ATP-dependent Clp protease proteolytic subunit n=1 Tax=Ornithinicoccus hortensis TaxID=82346 RepID=A0A542YME9_9MICO|nr:ATP-dependent Clp protease proteolytic subunit [Ornithinicoccus hortensis]TQL49265.1 ATP-dependent Clp protease protease subunit [Ornithinicoccus hortensis]